MWRKGCGNKVFLPITVVGAVVVAFLNNVMLPAYLAAVAPEIYEALRVLLREV